MDISIDLTLLSVLLDCKICSLKPEQFLARYWKFSDFYCRLEKLSWITATATGEREATTTWAGEAGVDTTTVMEVTEVTEGEGEATEVIPPILQPAESDYETHRQPLPRNISLLPSVGVVSQGRNKMYMQMCNEGTRGEKRRRDADDFDPESKLMRKLFVKNLSPDAKEADLREYFERFGTVETCDIARKPTGECKV